MCKDKRTKEEKKASLAPRVQRNKALMRAGHSAEHVNSLCTH
jgi:hypothetical protein